MRDVVAVEYVTVDGVMEEPAWSNEQFNDELARFQHDQLFASDALLLGRVTFEAFAAVWPSREETEGDFAVRMNALPKFVASRTLSEPLAWNGTLLEGDLGDEVAKLKRQPGEDLLIYGSGEVVNALSPARTDRQVHTHGLSGHAWSRKAPLQRGD
jgi:dihydrofolate reductase